LASQSQKNQESDTGECTRTQPIAVLQELVVASIAFGLLSDEIEIPSQLRQQIV
jgi:hypothetical protein